MSIKRGFFEFISAIGVTVAAYAVGYSNGNKENIILEEKYISEIKKLKKSNDECVASTVNLNKNVIEISKKLLDIKKLPPVKLNIIYYGESPLFDFKIIDVYLDNELVVEDVPYIKGFSKSINTSLKSHVIDFRFRFPFNETKSFKFKTPDPGHYIIKIKLTHKEGVKPKDRWSIDIKKLPTN